MKLHEQDINTGDFVYDLLEGKGRVSSVFGSSFAVTFSANRSYVYNDSGKRLGSTPARFPVMLYWQNPIIMIPVKDDSVWSQMESIFRNTYQTLKGS